MTGTVTLSIEIELGWGVARYRPIEKRISPNRERETETLHRLLSLCEDHNIPISFDVVGHLLHSECEGEHEGPHESGWFDIDPGTDVDTDPEFYAPDLIESIHESTVDHEICTHTYSHAEFGTVSDEVIEWEFERAAEMHLEFGLTQPTSFVAPRHSMSDRSLLADLGIDICRTPHYEHPDIQRPRKIKKYFNMLRCKQPLLPPERNNGVIDSWSTEYHTIAAPSLPAGTSGIHPAYRPVPRSLRRRLHAHGLCRSFKRTATEDSYSHYWAHLYDIANESQFPQVETAISALGELQRNGDIEVQTMANLAGGFKT